MKNARSEPQALHAHQECDPCEHPKACPLGRSLHGLSTPHDGYRPTSAASALMRHMQIRRAKSYRFVSATQKDMRPWPAILHQSEGLLVQTRTHFDRITRSIASALPH